MLCMLMSGWLEVFLPVLRAAIKTKRWWRLRGRRIIKKKQCSCAKILYQHLDTLLVVLCEKINKCKRLCGDRQDNKAVGADTQTGPSVSINEEGSFHAWHADSHFLPHEHTLFDAPHLHACSCVFNRTPPLPTTLTQPWASEQTFFPSL